MKILISASILLLFVFQFNTRCTGQFVGSDITYKHAGFPIGFSPDNKYIVCSTGEGNLEIWDLQTGKPYARYNAPIPEFPDRNIKDYAWSPDGSRLLTWQCKDSQWKQWAVLFDLKTKKVYDIDDQNGKFQVAGFCDQQTIWGYDHAANTVLTFSIQLDNERNKVSLTPTRTISKPDNWRDVIYVPKTDVFYVITLNDEGYQSLTGMARKGDSAFGPLPKFMLKPLKKKHILGKGHAHFIMHHGKNGYAVTNLADEQTTEVFTEQNIISESRFFSDKMIWSEPSGKFDNYFFRGQYLPSGRWQDTYKTVGFITKDCVFNADLSMAAVCERRPDGLLIKIYKTTDFSNPAVFLRAELSESMTAFLDFIATHKQEYESWKENKIQKQQYDSWELVETKVDMTQEAAEGQFYFNKDYEYSFVFAGYDRMARELNLTLPESDGLNYAMLIQPEDFGGRTFKNIEKSFKLSEINDFSLSSEYSTFIDFSFRQLCSNYDCRLPKETFELLVFRRSIDRYGAYFAEQLSSVQIVEPTSSSGSSTNECAPLLPDEPALEALRKLEKQMRAPESTTTIVTETGYGGILKTFFMPETSQMVLFLIITTGPCNTISLYKDNRTSLSEMVFEGRPDNSEEFENSEYYKTLTEQGFTLYQYHMKWIAVEGIGVQYVISVDGDGGKSEADGASLIWVGY